MATKTVNIDGLTWTAITTAGQSGTCWLNSNVIGNGCVVIDHSVISNALCDFSKSYPLYRDSGVLFSFTADSIADVYYARCVEPEASVTLTVDTI